MKSARSFTLLKFLTLGMLAACFAAGRISAYWICVAFGVVYAGSALMAYATDGPRYQVSLDLEDPTRLLKRLLIWLSVTAMAPILRAERSVLEILFEASAEVGELFIRWSWPRDPFSLARNVAATHRFAFQLPPAAYAPDLSEENKTTPTHLAHPHPP